MPALPSGGLARTCSGSQSKPGDLRLKRRSSLTEDLEYAGLIRKRPDTHAELIACGRGK